MQYAITGMTRHSGTKLVDAEQEMVDQSNPLTPTVSIWVQL